MWVNDWVNKFSDNDQYNSVISYDQNGNILTLMQNGDDDLAAMDDLTYTYYDSKNQLKRIVDGVPAGNYPDDIDSQPDEVNYEYDANGSLVKDRSEAINTITWTNAGKVQSITRDSHSPKPDLEFAYDGLGNRVKKEVITGTYEASTWYVRDASGNILAVYQKAGEDGLKLKERPIYGSSRLGVLNSDVGSSAGINILSHITGDRQYELTDHLGNVLVTISDRRTIEQNPAKYKAEIKSVGDYYPFGMLMPGRKYDPEGYRFGFNGQEKDGEIKGITDSHLAYDFRIYTSWLGRWLSPEQLAKKYPETSPYIFVKNNPIYFIDSEGLDLWIGGNSEKAINDIKSIIPEKYRGLITVANDNKIKFDASRITKEQFESDAGLVLINQLVNLSEKKFLYEVEIIAKGRHRSTGEEIEVPIGEGTSGVASFSITPRLEKGPKGLLPKEGYEGQVVIHPRVIVIEDIEGVEREQPRAGLIFHELQESYERTEHGLPYLYQDPIDPSKEDKTRKGAHRIAVENAKKLPESFRGKTPGRGKRVKFIE